jgi:hypothetical protein
MPALPDRTHSRAVLIGASRFAHLPDLPAVRNNLTDLSSALTDPTHGIIAPDNCVVVAEPESPHAFMKSLRQVVRTTDDFLFVYYAGHGLKNDAGDRLYLTVGQTDHDELDGSAVAFDSVKRALENSFARTTLLVLDCCYSGMAAGFMSDGGVSRWEIEVRGAAVLASSPRNKPSHSPEGHQHTAFTGKVVDLLRNGSPIRDEPLTVNTLYRRVAVALARDRFPEPKLALTETSGDLLVRRLARPLPQVNRAPVQSPEPATVRLPPVSPALVLSTPAHPMPQRGDRPLDSRAGTSARRGQLTGLQVLWTLTGVFLAMFLGGLFGVATGSRRPDGTQGDDASTLWIGLVLTVACVTPLWFLRRHWLSLRRDLGTHLITRVLVGRIVVLIGLLFFVGMIITGLTVRPSTEVRSGSEVMSTVGLEVVMIEGAVLCGYLLVAWQRSRLARSRAVVGPDSRA